MHFIKSSIGLLVICLFIFPVAEAQTPRLVLPIHGSLETRCMDISPNGKLIITGDARYLAILWDAKTGAEIRSIFVGSPVQKVKFMEDGNSFITLSIITGSSMITPKYRVLQWETKSGNLLRSYPFTCSDDFSMSPDGNWFLLNNFEPNKPPAPANKKTQANDIETLVSGKQMKYSVWDNQSQQIKCELTNLSKNVSFIRYQDSICLLSLAHKISDDDKKSKVDIISINRLSKKPRPVKQPLSPGAGNEQLTQMLGEDYMREVSDLIQQEMMEKFKDMPGYKVNVKNSAAIDKSEVIRSLILPIKVRSMITSPNGKKLVAADREGNLLIWDIEKDKELGRVRSSSKYIKNISFSADGSVLFAYSLHNDGSYVNAWQLESLIPVLQEFYNDRLIHMSCFSPDGKYFLLKNDKGIASYNMQKKKMIELKKHNIPVWKTGFSSTSDIVYTDSKYDMGFSAQDSKKLDEIMTYAAQMTLHMNDSAKSMSQQEKNRLITEKKKENETELNKQMLAQQQRMKQDPTPPFYWDLRSGSVSHSNDLSLQILEDSISPDKSMIISRDYFNNDNLVEGYRTTMKNMQANKAAFADNAYLTMMMDSSNALYSLMKDKQNSPNETIFLTSRKTNTKIRLIPIDTTDYVFVLENGYYMGSKQGAQGLHYVINNDVLSFGQLDVKYNRPDIVLEAIGRADSSLIRSYKRAYDKRIEKLGIDTTSFRSGYSIPESDWVDREKIKDEQPDGTLPLQLKGSDKTYMLDRYQVWVNGSPLYGKGGISIRKKVKKEMTATVNINLSDGENRIEASVMNVNGTESYRSPLIVHYTPEKPSGALLYFIGLATDRFSDPQYNLRYSVKDIRDLAFMLKARYGNRMVIDTLFNEEVTKDHIKALKQKLTKTNINDKVLISFSGHGLFSSTYDYFLSSYDIQFDKPEQNGIPYELLEDLLDGIPARKKLMMLDACHSGEVDKSELRQLDSIKNTLGLKGIKPVKYKNAPGEMKLRNGFELMQDLFVNVDKNTGATIISAAGGTQFALEKGSLENGVFTYSILECMQQREHATVSELKKYVNRRVPELTGGLQQPTAREENIDNDWMLW